MEICRRLIAYLTIVFGLLAAGGVVAAAPIESPTTFVQDFYDWYVPLASQDDTRPAWESALKLKPQHFDRELLTALTADADAQNNSTGEIVGIDFDPFLASQDPGGGYSVGGVSREDQTYWVEVRRSASQREEPAVWMGLQRQQNAWRITNLRYPGGHDLLRTLRLLHEDRQNKLQ